MMNASFPLPSRYDFTPNVDDFSHHTSLLPGAGRGVFVTRPFTALDPVCHYHGYLARADQQLTSSEDEYMTNYGGGRLVGYMVRQRGWPAGVGQLINDGAIPNLLDGTFPHQRDLATQIKWVASRMTQYEQDSYSKANVRYRIPRILEFYAVRLLCANEELYTSYGSAYWLAWFVSRHPEISTALQCALDLHLLFHRRFALQMCNMRGGDSNEQKHKKMLEASVLAWVEIFQTGDDVLNSVVV